MYTHCTHSPHSFNYSCIDFQNKFIINKRLPKLGECFLLKSIRKSNARRFLSTNCNLNDNNSKESKINSKSISLLKKLDELQEEMEQNQAKANNARSRFIRLSEAVNNLRESALKSVLNQDENSARRTLYEKHKVFSTLETVKARAEIYESLSNALAKAISLKEFQLLSDLLEAKNNVNVNGVISNEEQPYEVRHYQPSEKKAEVETMDDAPSFNTISLQSSNANTTLDIIVDNASDDFKNEEIEDVEEGKEMVKGMATEILDEITKKVDGDENGSVDDKEKVGDERKEMDDNAENAQNEQAITEKVIDFIENNMESILKATLNGMDAMEDATSLTLNNNNANEMKIGERNERLNEVLHKLNSFLGTLSDNELRNLFINTERRNLEKIFTYCFMIMPEWRDSVKNEKPSMDEQMVDDLSVLNDIVNDLNFIFDDGSLKFVNTILDGEEDKHKDN